MSKLIDITEDITNKSLTYSRLFAADAAAYGESLRERHFSEWVLPPDR
jgi:hypothetical protein